MLFNSAAQVSETIVLEPINLTANGSACPGQDVTLNCTVVRTVNQNNLLPTLIWVYNKTMATRSDGTTSGTYDPSIFTAVFNSFENSTVMSTVTILSVPLSYHNSEIRCQTGTVVESREISVAGQCNFNAEVPDIIDDV